MNDSYVKRAWTNYSQPGSLRALHGFVKTRGIKDIREAEKNLSNIYAFSVHKPARRKYPTRAIILKGPREHFCVDLIDLQKYSRKNSGFNWLVTALDGFTKELFVQPVKKKTTQQVADAFALIIKQAKKPIRYVYSDMGLEFIGKSFQDLMTKHNITHYVSKTKRKAAMCERVIKTLKQLLFKYFTHEKSTRWVEVLPKLVNSYNNTPHSSHGLKPNSIKPKDVDNVFHQLYAKLAQVPVPSPKYKVGDRVRIAKSRLTFQKGYEQSFSDDVFKISSYVPGSHPVVSYKLETLSGEPVISSFVEQELGYAESHDGSS
ncbi:MAG: transposase family protein [Bacteroidota bacterium]